MTVLDHVSRPDAFAVLYGPLVRGYALDALEAAVDAAAPAPPSLDEATAFVDRLAATRVSRRDGIGPGRDARFARPGLAGGGLVAGDELVQLTAFADIGDTPGPRARIRRPSRRR